MRHRAATKALDDLESLGSNLIKPQRSSRLKRVERCDSPHHTFMFSFFLFLCPENIICSSFFSRSTWLQLPASVHMDNYYIKGLSWLMTSDPVENHMYILLVLDSHNYLTTINLSLHLGADSLLKSLSLIHAFILLSVLVLRQSGVACSAPSLTPLPSVFNRGASQMSVNSGL